MRIDFVIPCLLGMESLIAGELKEFGAENVNAENGRVLFSGDENILARVNICSRYAERVQILVGSFEARSFEELFQGVKAIPWGDLMPIDAEMHVIGRSVRSGLFSVPDCQSITKKAIIEKGIAQYINFLNLLNCLNSNRFVNCLQKISKLLF